jgi:hypothetical protein
LGKIGKGKYITIVYVYLRFSMNPFVCCRKFGAIGSVCVGVCWLVYVLTDGPQMGVLTSAGWHTFRLSDLYPNSPVVGHLPKWTRVVVPRRGGTVAPGRRRYGKIYLISLGDGT